MEFQRLKDKLGTRSLPSSEVEFRGAAARLLGEEGRGVATIIEMVTHTRLDCVIGSASVDAPRASPRRSGTPATASAFGARLVEQPAMVNVLADLALESEAATATALRLARAYDEDDTRVAPLRHRDRQVLGLQARDAARGRGAGVPGRQRLRRGVADAAAAARRAAERHLGGLGQRDRARRPARAGARAGRPGGLRGRVRAGARRERAARRAPRLAAGARSTRGARGARSRSWRWRSRRRCSCGFAPPFVADAFCAARLGGGGRVYGTLPAGVDGAAIVARALQID